MIMRKWDRNEIEKRSATLASVLEALLAEARGEKEETVAFQVHKLNQSGGMKVVDHIIVKNDIYYEVEVDRGYLFISGQEIIHFMIENGYKVAITMVFSHVSMDSVTTSIATVLVKDTDE